jgi:hypothetical protein
MKEVGRNEYIGDKYNNVFDFLMKECKAKLLKNLGTSNPLVLNREWEQATHRIKTDVAFSIFDEVNFQNDTLKFVDLSCLDSEDAMFICKMKLIELARTANEQYRLKGKKAHYVLNIKCAEDHLMIIEDQFGRQPLKNCIVEMIGNEL